MATVILVWLGLLAVATFAYLIRRPANGRHRKAAEKGEVGAANPSGSTAGIHALYGTAGSSGATGQTARTNLGLAVGTIQPSYGGSVKQVINMQSDGHGGQIVTYHDGTVEHHPSPHLASAPSASYVFAQGQLAMQKLQKLAAAQQAGFIGQPAAIERPPLDIENKFGEIVGFRCWHFRYGLLWSVAQDNVWVPGEIEGLMPGQKVTDYGMEGIHAYKAKKNAIMHCAGNGNIVVGTVKLWGEVIEHDRGYRAEFACIKSLDMFLGDGDCFPKLEALRKLYCAE